MNLAGEGDSADYIVSGHWSAKAVSEAKPVCAGERRGQRRSGRLPEAAPARQLAARPECRLRALHAERDDPRRGVPRHTRVRRGAAGRGHVLEHPVRTAGRLPLRADLCRCAEEHRPVRPGADDRPPRPAAAGRPADGEDLPLRRACRRRFDAQHAEHLGLVRGRADLPVAAGAGRAGRDGRAQPRQGRIAVPGHRRLRRLLPQPDRAVRALTHERAVHPARRRAGRGVPAGVRGRRPACAERPQGARRDARVAVQRGAARGRRRRWWHSCGTSRSGTADRAMAKLFRQDAASSFGLLSIQAAKA